MCSAGIQAQASPSLSKDCPVAFEATILSEPESSRGTAHSRNRSWAVFEAEGKSHFRLLAKGIDCPASIAGSAHCWLDTLR